jgi:hypothetical protein
VAAVAWGVFRTREMSGPEEVMIGDAVAGAAAHLKGRKFSPDDIPVVDAAFARFGRKRPSDDVGECAAALMKLMSD